MLTAGARLGPYEIVALLGAGGMGEVYRARDTRLGRDVAIKVLPARFTDDADRLRRFEREARAVAALDHPNILAIHDVGSHEGSPYFVTELLEGESLRACLRSGKLAPRRAVELAVQIARGLAAAHEKGFIHRDLKPENVFLARNGVVKILDFGLAKLARPEADPGAPTVAAMDSTEEGAVAGTQGYMSPEQLRGLTLDQRTDIFSFGCVLYEMLSGRRAFLRDNAADTTSAVLHDEPATLPAAVPGPLGAIVDRCLEKRREDRFSSAHDLALALRVAEGRPGGDEARSWAPWRGRRGRWALAGTGVVVVVLACAWLLTHGRTAPLPEFHPRKVAGQFGSVADAAISPDGNEVAYTVEEAGTSVLWVADIRGGRPIRLTDGSSSVFGPAWFPDGGAVAFSSSAASETSIMKVPRTGGSVLPLVTDAQDAALSPDGKLIAFARPQEDGALRIWVAPLESPEVARRLTHDGAGLWDHRHPSWSPDGRTICYSDQRELWLVPAEGGAARRFTEGDDGDAEPVWSASGRHVYFRSERAGVRSLWRKALAGGAAVRVTRGAGIEQSPTISRGGTRLAFLSGSETYWIALLDLRTGDVGRVELGSRAAMATFAPDGSSLVFTSNAAGPSDLWSVALQGSAVVGEPTRRSDQPGSCATPAFSPDGRWIAYHRVTEGERDVWVMPAHGGTPVNFTARKGVDIQPAWSPDGREIAFVSDRAGFNQVWAAPFAAGRRTGEARRITSEEGDAAVPRWSVGGRSIAYVLGTGAGAEVREVPADGSGRSRALTSGARAWMLGWCRARDGWLVSGFWGERRPSIRLLPASGGAPERLRLPSQLVLDLEYPNFDVSSDGEVLALFQRTRREEVWVLQADEGAF